VSSAVISPSRASWVAGVVSERWLIIAIFASADVPAVRSRTASESGSNGGTTVPSPP
jgi:hypothetical protein